MNEFKIIVEPTEGFAAGVEGAAAASVDVSSMAALPAATIVQIVMSLLTLVIKDPAKLALIQQIANWILPLVQKS